MEQEIYDLIFKKIRDMGYDCYPFLPDEKAPYPFVVVGETSLNPKPTKSFSLGEVSVVVHVWARKDSRKECAKIMDDVFKDIRIFRSPHVRTLLDCSRRILADNSTNDVLRHGVLDLTYKFY